MVIFHPYGTNPVLCRKITNEEEKILKRRTLYFEEILNLKQLEKYEKVKTEEVMESIGMLKMHIETGDEIISNSEMLRKRRN